MAEGTIEQFVERYSNYIVPARCQIHIITAANLQKKFRQNEQEQSCCALRLESVRIAGTWTRSGDNVG